MKKNLRKTFQSILSCITVFTLIIGIMAGGAVFANIRTIPWKN
ncbi:hypothetical protein [Acetivibrio saccincola]|nr:hypothetical protein [Acetivibrio saccincola]HQD29752.1 hypothetical protein [Acetivibrio saccincola]